MADLPRMSFDQIEANIEPSPELDQVPLYPPIEDEEDLRTHETIDRKEWQVTAQQDWVPGNILGTMVHKAIQRWLFPDDPRLSQLLETTAINAGLVSEKQKVNAIETASELLAQLRQHPLWEKINNAKERYFELPYTYQINEKTNTGYIDLLYHDEDGWHIVDFKTDRINTPTAMEERLLEYRPQVKRYREAVKALLNTQMLCYVSWMIKVR